MEVNNTLHQRLHRHLNITQVLSPYIIEVSLRSTQDWALYNADVSTIQYQRVSDGQTDGWTEHGYNAAAQVGSVPAVIN